MIKNQIQKISAVLTVTLLIPTSVLSEEKEILGSKLPSNSPMPIQSYVQCGCGCCPEGTIKDHKCVYRAKGETLEKLQETDQKWQEENRELCARTGCALGVVYKYCD